MGDGGTLPSPDLRSSWAIGAIIAAVGVVAAVAGALVLLGTCGSGGSTLPTNPVEATQDSIANGARLYQANCVICHGTDGRGSLMAPDLTVHVLTRQDGFLFERISRGFPADSEFKTMPSFGGVFS